MVEDFYSGEYATIIERLLAGRKVKKTGDELSCCCPFHDEQHASFSINLSSGAFICFACGEHGSITDFVAKMENIPTTEAWKEIQEECGYISTTSMGYTLEDYAAEKNLDIAFLKGLNVKTDNDGKNIAIPYYDENGNHIRTRYRNRPDNKYRFYWDNSNSPVCLYGIWRIKDYSNDYVILVEGESDCHAAWCHNIQALGVPGAKNFKKDYSKFFEKFKKIYIHSEEDEGANTFIKSICSVLPIEKLFKISSKSIDNACKDIADLHVHNALNIDTLLNTAEKLLKKSNEELQDGKEPHVTIGEELINKLSLKYLNGTLFSFKNGYYCPITDQDLRTCIVREININAKSHLCTEAIQFVYNWLGCR